MHINSNTIKKSTPLIGWLICLLGAIFYCYEYLLRIEPSVMVNEIMAQLNITSIGFGFITGIYYNIYTPMQMVVGILIDRYGTRLMIGMAVIACALGSFLFSISHAVLLASIARFLIGFGSSFAFVGVLKLATEWLPKHRFALFAGMTTALGMLGGMVGDIGLSSMIHEIGWRNTQHIGTIFGIVLIPIIFLLVRDTPRWKTSPINLNNNNSLKQTFIGLKKIIKNPQMWLCGIVGGALYLSLSAFAELWGIKFLQTVYTLSHEQAGIVCSMIFIGWLVGGPFCGWLSDRIGSRKLPLIVGGLIATTCISVVILKPFAIPFSILCALLFLFGVSSSAQIVCFAISCESNPSNVSATAVAFTNLMVMVGGMIFQPLVGVLLEASWAGQVMDGVHVYSIYAYQKAFLTIPICIAAGSLLAIKLKETLKD
jgi:MFS family permease